MCSNECVTAPAAIQIKSRVAIRAEEANNTTRLVAGTRRALAYANNAFPTVPIFTVGAS